MLNDMNKLQSWIDMFNLLNLLTVSGTLSETTYYYYCSQFMQLIDENPYE